MVWPAVIIKKAQCSNIHRGRHRSKAVTGATLYIYLRCEVRLVAEQSPSPPSSDPIPRSPVLGPRPKCLEWRLQASQVPARASCVTRDLAWHWSCLEHQSWQRALRKIICTSITGRFHTHGRRAQGRKLRGCQDGGCCSLPGVQISLVTPCLLNLEPPSQAVLNERHGGGAELEQRISSSAVRCGQVLHGEARKDISPDLQDGCRRQQTRSWRSRDLAIVVPPPSSAVSNTPMHGLMLLGDTIPRPAHRIRLPAGGDRGDSGGRAGQAIAA